VRKHGHQPSPLERGGQHPLVLRARSALATRIDLASVADVSADTADVFVVDLLDLIDAERADLAPGSTEAWRPAVPTAGSAGARWTIAPRATWGAGARTAVGNLLAHHSLLERDLVGIE